MTLTIFYDGQCPLCTTEMKHLKEHDKLDAIHLVDLHQIDFTALYPHINVDDGMKILHGTYQGELLLGLKVTHRAWTLVGKGFWVAPLNWPIISTISHWIYLLVAKYRQPISTFLAKRLGINADNCNSGTCYDKNTDSDHRR